MGIIVALPHTSHAGILTALVKFFSLGSSEREEKFPAFIPESKATADDSVLDADTPPSAGGDGTGDAAPFTVIQDHALLAPLNPLGTFSAEGRVGGQIFIYTIRPGDTLSAIAQSFDVSVNTILWANSISDFRNLRTGATLIILPVTGVKHEVKSGDTIVSIAKKYHASIEDIIRFNGLALDEHLAIGSTVIVPNGELPYAAPLTARAPQSQYFSNLPFYEGFYLRPIIGGRRSRGLHGFNGVDLANSCGFPVLASAHGSVIIARTSGWNGGYGRYVVLAHANGTQTLYGHLKDLAVAAGSVVRQGDVIGFIGSSGNSTGCHIHFEIRGARNPF